MLKTVMLESTFSSLPTAHYPLPTAPDIIPPMNSQPVTVNRSLVGAIGLGLLAVAGLIWALGLEESNGMWCGACLKVGIVMAALWLALPSITRNPELGRASLGVVVGTVAVALLLGRTRIPLTVLVPTVLGIAFVLRILKPARSTRPPRPGE